MLFKLRRAEFVCAEFDFIFARCLAPCPAYLNDPVLLKHIVNEIEKISFQEETAVIALSEEDKAMIAEMEARTTGTWEGDDDED